jgi:dihydroorotase
MTSSVLTRAATLVVFVTLLPLLRAQQPSYDLVLDGAHVIDPRNGLSAPRDVAISDGRIAAIAPDIPATQAGRVVDVRGLYVSPGLIDIHTHVYPGERRGTYAGGDLSVMPDGFTLRSCVTTVADAGSSGWRTFEDFKARVVDRSRTRVTAFINIVGAGMREGRFEQNVDDMEVEPTLAMALAHRGIIVGVKSAHFNGAEWTPYDRAGEVGRRAGIPVMVDFGGNVKAGRTIMALVTEHFRPGDIYTHAYGGVRGEQDAETGGPSAAMVEGRRRGVKFDVGHGGGSFRWAAAVPMTRAGFLPDSISTDLHIDSMNSGMKSMIETMSKFLALGQSLDDVVRWSTDNPAKQIQKTELGHLTVGAPADVAVFRVERGDFGFVDQTSDSLTLPGSERLTCEITFRDGEAVYDLNGRTKPRFTSR